MCFWARDGFLASDVFAILICSDTATLYRSLVLWMHFTFELKVFPECKILTADCSLLPRKIFALSLNFGTRWIEKMRNALRDKNFHTVIVVITDHVNLIYY